MSAPMHNRITPKAAVVAVQAVIGDGCQEDLAVDVVEVVRPHLESPYVALIETLRRELSSARDEIARLSNDAA